MLQGKGDIGEELQRVSRGHTGESCVTLGISANFSELPRLCNTDFDSASQSLGEDGRRPCERGSAGSLAPSSSPARGSWLSPADESGDDNESAAGGGTDESETG